MCTIEVFKRLNRESSNAFRNNIMKINHSHNSRCILKAIVRYEAGKTFAFQREKIFNNLTDEMKAESSIVIFEMEAI